MSPRRISSSLRLGRLVRVGGIASAVALFSLAVPVAAAGATASAGGRTPSKPDVQVAPSLSIPAASVSSDFGAHTCALTSTGGVECWGDNAWGELGDGTTTNRLTPVAVSGLSSGVSAVTSGGDATESHTCVLTAAGGVKCWGSNDAGELGIGGGPNQLTPVDVPGLTSGVAEVSAANYYTCRVDHRGWGQVLGRQRIRSAR